MSSLFGGADPVRLSDDGGVRSLEERLEESKTKAPVSTGRQVDSVGGRHGSEWCVFQDGWQ